MTPTRAKTVAWWFVFLLLAGCDDSTNGDKPQAPADSNKDASITNDMDGGDDDAGNPPVGPSKDSGIVARDSGISGTGGSGGKDAGGGGTGGKSGVKPGKPARQCKAIEACDIAESACRDDVLALTACIRGSDLPDPLPVRTITRDELQAELMARAQELGLKESPWDTGLIRLGLLVPGATTVSQAIGQEVESVTAFYEHDPQRITLIEQAMPGDQEQQMYLLSHEYVHYMQDLEVGLAKLRKRYSESSDANNAGTALVEGEAIVSATRALARIQGTPIADIDFRGMTDTMLSDMMIHIATSNGALQAANETLPYPVGIRYIADVWNGFDRAHVDALFQEAPMALIDWIHGYGDGEIAPTLIEPLDCGVPEAPAGYELWASDSLGAAGALAMLAVTAGDNSTTARDFTLVGKLRGDTVAVYATGTGPDAPLSPVVVAWRLRFADAKSATAFEARAAMLQLTTQTFDNEVLLTGGDQTNPLTGTALEACPKAQPLMRPPHSDLLAAAHGGQHARH